MGLKSLHVAAEAPSGVATEVRRRLSGTPVKLETDARKAEVQLRILSESTDKTIQTLTGAGRVFDYVLRLTVGFHAADAAGNPLVEPTTIEVRRLAVLRASGAAAK